MTQEERYKIINGNSLEVLDTLEENSIDAIICDPPYELGFMGKKWDSTGIACNVDLWKKALRVLKPCGHLLAFGGSRTFHRIACAIEDAGFEIRDTIMWLYGSGFPKSMNIGKSIESYETFGNSSTSNKRQVEQSCGGETFIVKQTNNGAMGEIREQERKIYTPNTELAKKWYGWGTCLKPAFEPVIMARKPSNLSTTENCLKWGVGGLNIDECRVGNEHFVIEDSDYDNNENQRCYGNVKRTPKEYNGRFPANIITDGSEEVAMGMPNTSSTQNKDSDERQNNGNSMFIDGVHNPFNSYEDKGSAMRYFYCAKASKKDRDNGLDLFESMAVNDGRKTEIDNAFQRGETLRKNIHPTVKPVELMQYLVRLVSPKGATILDIFNGSGSTGKAVAFENRERNADYKYIGIELDEKYCEISKARIDYAVNKFQYDIKEEIKENAQKGQLSLFDF